MNMFSSNADFYPTPVEVINQMMIGEDVSGKTVLEPSAGSGNIVEWLWRAGAANVIACENDPILLKILRGKCDILAEDFLTVTSEQVSHVDYIVMNPPFSEGAKHILHAFDIAPAGCTIIALCNSSNFDRDWNHGNTKKLKETVELYGQSEYMGEVFKDSERCTNVGVELVKLYKPGEGSSEFDGYFFSQFDDDQARANDGEGLIKYNLVRELVGRYVSAVKLFDETLKAAQLINETAVCPEADDKGPIPIRFATVNDEGKAIDISRQRYKKELQKYYWRIIFRKLKMEKYATRQLREQINKFVEKQTNVPFTMRNIYQVLQIVVQTNGPRMNKALEEAFDTICSFSAENSTAGEKWRTNANYMVNRRFILPGICEGYWWHSKNSYPYLRLSYCNLENRMDDITKALCMFTGRNYEEIPTLWALVNTDNKEWGEWFEWGFFRCRGYKKGTMHFEFLDDDVWFKFNYEVAKMKGWSLPKKTGKKVS